MNRELKFRVWHTEYGQMITEAGYIQISGDGTISVFIEDGNGVWDSRQSKLVVMQYTGLKDKNRVKIFDGDVLSGGMYKAYAVKWDAEQAGWNIGLLVQHNYEIIGNIHEHPRISI